ncbi:MAG: UDP-glucose/GDP-mannose dehydrogenase family protein [Candidatus Saccharimonadales bacterium]
MKSIVVVGTGYVGLVSGTCFAELGNQVTCVDINEVKVRQMQAGHIPIFEPGLEELFTRNIADGRLQFTTQLADVVPAADIIFLALPTPPNEDGSADLSYVLAVADQLGPLLADYTVVVTKSTVPVGTGAQVEEHIAAAPGASFAVVSNPEFLREGVAVHDFMEPGRVVIGTDSEQARTVMGELYAPLTTQSRPVIFMDRRSAELTKYAANSFLALKISFMNEVANLCERVDADVDAVRRGIGSDERIGHHFLYAGIGYGGSCFPKDVQALLHTAHEHGYDFNLLDAIITLNSKQQKVLTQKVLKHFGNDIAGKTFALWGLAFKADTDDIRRAPALGIIQDLIAAGAHVQAYDPEAMENARQHFGDTPNLTFAKDEFAALENADALLVATEWPQFRAVPLDKLKQLLKTPAVFDGRNIFPAGDMRTHGFYYEGIGRPLQQQDSGS